MHRTIVFAGFAALMAATTIPLAPPARAQIGNIFTDPVPRPPAAIPRGNQPPPDEEEEVPVLPPQGRVLPARPTGPPPGQASAMPGPVQSAPLAPPPGTTVVPQNAPPSATVAPPQPSQANLPPGQRQPKGAPQTPATLQPGDEVVTEPPAQKIINKKASFSGLDKITGRIINFDAAIGETVQFGALQVTPRVCYTRPPTETPNTDAFIEVDEVTLQGEVKRIFTGWMFAASPGLHAVEHPIYDVWITDCKNPVVAVVAPPEPPPPAAAPAPAKPAPAGARRSSSAGTPRANLPPPR